MNHKEKLSSLFALDEMEAEGLRLFTDWYKEFGSLSITNERTRFPAIRPIGLTVELPHTTLTEEDVFPPGYDVALTVHPRYFTAVAHSHTFFELVYMFSGHCRLFVDGRETEMNVGDVCILPPGIFHSMEAFNPEDIAVNLQFRSSTFLSSFSVLQGSNATISAFFQQAFSPGGITTHYLIFRTGSDSPVREVLLNMLWEYREGGAYSSQLLSAYASAFFALLLRHHFSTVRVMSISGTKPNDAIAAMLAYMDEHVKTVDLKTMAERFHYSETYVSRQLVRYTGMNFRQLLRSTRIDKAKRLLSGTTMPIADIASELGYSGLSELYRAFTQQGFLPPAQYRQQSRK